MHTESVSIYEKDEGLNPSGGSLAVAIRIKTLMLSPSHSPNADEGGDALF